MLRTVESISERIVEQVVDVPQFPIRFSVSQETSAA